MKPMTREWVEKAEGDFATMEREFRARKHRNNDALCFHSQQCAEKYLKAVLHHAGEAFPRTHDLVALLEHVLKVEPSWEVMRADLDDLTTHAVATRYPGWSTSRAVAKRAVGTAHLVRERARLHLRLKP